MDAIATHLPLPSAGVLILNFVLIVFQEAVNGFVYLLPRDMVAGIGTMHEIALFLRKPERYVPAQHLGEDGAARPPGPVRAALIAGSAGVAFRVILLSALALGTGTAIGFEKIVVTLGEKMGSAGIKPAQGTAARASAMVGIALALPFHFARA